MQNILSNPLISIIVPVFNLEKLVVKCIESILNQTYENFELFLIDDGSTDNSFSVCKSYAEKDSRIIVLKKENGGQGSARNMALDLAKGEYISFVDADDTLKPEFIESLLNAAVENNAEMAICGIAVNSGMRFIDKDVYPSECTFSTTELLKEYVTTGNIFSGPCNKLYKSCLFDNLRFPDFRANEDAYIMHELLGRSKKAVHIGKCLYIQYIRPGSTEQSAVTKKNLALLACADSLMNYFENNYPEMFQYVAYKKANDIVSLMRRILCVPRSKRDKVLYSRLNAELKKEFEKANQKFPNSTYVKSETVLAFKRPFVFHLVCVKKRFKYFVKLILRC